MQCLFASKFCDTLQCTIFFIVKRIAEYRTYNTIDGIMFCTRKHRHDIDVQLSCGFIFCGECRQLAYTLLALKEFLVMLHGTAELCCLGHFQFVHLHGNEIGTKFLAV